MSCVCVDQTTDEKGRWLRQGRVGKSALLAWKDFPHACGDATNENGGMGWGSGGAVTGAWGWDVGWMHQHPLGFLCFFLVRFLLLGSSGVFFLVLTSLCVLSLLSWMGRALHGDWWFGTEKGEKPHAHERGFWPGVLAGLTLLHLWEQKIPSISIPMLVLAWMWWFVAHRWYSELPEHPFFFLHRREFYCVPPTNAAVNRYG